MRSVLRSVTHIAGLWAVAIAQPLFDVIERAPEFLVAHRADAVDQVTLALVLVLAGPVVSVLVLIAAHLVSHSLARGLAAAIIGAVAGVLAVQVGYALGAPGWTVAVVVGGLASLVAAIAWSRIGGVQTFLTVSSPATITRAKAMTSDRPAR